MRLMTVRQLVKEDPRILGFSLAVSGIYGLVYYWSAGFISRPLGQAWQIVTIPSWQAKLWQMRSPFLWEAVSRIDMPPLLSVLISVPNLFVMAVLSLLVFGNLIVVLIGIRHPKVCRINASGGRLAALLPALFTGFGCCAPTVIILWVSLFGSVSSVMVVAIRWLLPLGMILLFAGVITGYRAVEPSR